MGCGVLGPGLGTFRTSETIPILTCDETFNAMLGAKRGGVKLAHLGHGSAQVVTGG
jgi:hypothetical protein